MEHLCVVELTYTLIFSFKFTLRCQLSAIVSIDTSGKICHRYQQQQRYWWQNLPLLSTTPAVPVVPLHFRISPRIFEKIWNDPNVIFGDLGEDDSWKKPEAKNLVTLSLSVKVGGAESKTHAYWILQCPPFGPSPRVTKRIMGGNSCAPSPPPPPNPGV